MSLIKKTSEKKLVNFVLKAHSQTAMVAANFIIFQECIAFPMKCKDYYFPS